MNSRVLAIVLGVVAAAGLLAPAQLSASETITYQYDALGRLVSSQRSGDVNNGLTTQITYDDADNRQAYVVTGSANAYFGASWTSAHSHQGTAGNWDVLILQGNYTLSGGFGGLTSVEEIRLLSGSVTTFGDLSAGSYDYTLVMADANVAAGQTLLINAGSLLAGEVLSFNGAAETDGQFVVTGGADSDAITAGRGADVVNAGLGNDVVFGLAGADTLNGEGGNDELRGQDGVDTINGGIGNDNLFGGPGNDVINGGDDNDTLSGGADIDLLIGDAGDDILAGDLGRDSMVGGAGLDSFNFLRVADSTVGLADQILDFSATDDLIGLSAIDANSNTVGDDAFTFVGASAFSSTAGELRASSSGPGSWFVEGDVNGNGIADFQIEVFTPGPLVGADFVQ